jgi:hypothetical protein
MSGNKMLQRIAENLLANPDQEPDEEVNTLVRTNDWQRLDAYIRDRPGVVEFEALLKQLFLMRYFRDLPRKPFEIAMGIQQVRWMVDPANCRDFPNYSVLDATFSYFENIPEGEKPILLNEIFTNCKFKITNPAYTSPESLVSFFQGTVWYNVQFARSVPGWPGYGSTKTWYPIPETMNLSSIACIYAPQLVFGSLSDISLLKHIVNYQQRPFVSHIPDAKSNLCNIHNIKHCVVAAWKHDITHSRSGSCKNGLSYINGMCGGIIGTPVNITSFPQLQEDLNNPESNLSICLNTVRDTSVNRKNGYYIARILNDTGVVHHESFPVMRGGKRKTRRTRKSSRKQSRRFKKR